MARYMSSAATDESTPPERPRIALDSPTCSRILRMDSSMIDSGVNDGVAAAGLVEERAQDLHALGRVHDLGVELHGVEAALAVFHRGHGRAAARRQHLEAGRRLGDAVAVAHPALLFAAHALEDEPPLEHVERGLAELAEAGARDGAAELEGDALGAVADAQDGDAQLEDLGVDPGRVVDVDAHGPAGEDDALGLVALDALDRGVVRDELRVDPALAHAARDELPVLGPVVEDQDGVEPFGLRRTLRHCASLCALT